MSESPMNLTGIWDGTLDGTNWGRLLAKLQEDTSGITGFAQVVDVGQGTYNLNARGVRKGEEILISLRSARGNVREYGGKIEVAIVQTGDASVEGEWKSTLGTYGKFRAVRQAPTQAVSPEAYALRIAESNAAFIIMAFEDQQPAFLPTVDILAAVKRACDQTGVPAHRVDEVEHSGLITNVILDSIKTHRFLISDLTHQRQNVYYEVGYAHGLGKGRYSHRAEGYANTL